MLGVAASEQVIDAPDVLTSSRLRKRLQAD